MQGLNSIDGYVFVYSSNIDAEKKCLDYSHGGYDDWFLPSIDELCEMYNALNCQGGTNHELDCPRQDSCSHLNRRN